MMSAISSKCHGRRSCVSTPTSAVLGLASTLAVAQDKGYLHADLRRETERISDACKDFSFKAVPGCAIELFTDHPLHIAAGSLPPQNGFGLNAAYAVAWDTKMAGA